MPSDCAMSRNLWWDTSTGATINLLNVSKFQLKNWSLVFLQKCPFVLPLSTVDVSVLASQVSTNIFWIPGILLQLMSFRSIAGPMGTLRSSHRFGILQGSLARYAFLSRTVDIPRFRNSESKGWIVWILMVYCEWFHMIPCLCMIYIYIYAAACVKKIRWMPRNISKYSTHLPDSESTNHILWTKSSSIFSNYQKHSLILQVKATVFCHGFSGTSPCRPDSLVDSTNAMRAMGDPTPTSRLDIAGHMACAPPRAGCRWLFCFSNTYPPTPR